MLDTIAQVKKLHAAYVMLSGQRITLNAQREREWWDWLQFRKEDPFTEESLRVVIAHIRRGIRDGKRNVGALKFRNLIGCPDFFEEDLEEALSHQRKATVPPARAAALHASGRPADSQPGHERLQAPDDATERQAGEVIASHAFQEFCKLKEKL